MTLNHLAETAWNRLQIIGLLWETPSLALAYGNPVELARAIPDKELEARSLSSLGTISLLKGDFQTAISFGEAALALYADLDDYPGASHKLSLTSFMGGSMSEQANLDRLTPPFVRQRRSLRSGRGHQRSGAASNLFSGKADPTDDAASPARDVPGIERAGLAGAGDERHR